MPQDRPPLTIAEDALRESLAVFEEACDEVLLDLHTDR